MKKIREIEKESLNIMEALGERLKKELTHRGRGARFSNQSLCSWRKSAGQSLIELIIALTIGAIFIGGSTYAIALMLRNNVETRMNQSAASLAKEYADNIKTISESRWHEIYCPPIGVCPGSPKGVNSQFHLAASGTTYAILDGATSTIIDGKTISRYFSIENVNRDLCGVGNATSTATTTCASPDSMGVEEDFSTQKITINVAWDGGGTLKLSQYLTRNQAKVFQQTDWSGGDNQEAFSSSSVGTIVNNKFASSTNIDFNSSKGQIKIKF